MDADYVVVCFDGVYDERLVPLFREIYVMFEVFRLFFIADSAFESSPVSPIATTCSFRTIVSNRGNVSLEREVRLHGCIPTE